jgi:hypothetical protein
MGNNVTMPALAGPLELKDIANMLITGNKQKKANNIKKI